MTSRIREIPTARGVPPEVEAIVGPLVEYTQNIRGRRQGAIAKLQGAPTLNELANKINEIIDRLQE